MPESQYPVPQEVQWLIVPEQVTQLAVQMQEPPLRTLPLTQVRQEDTEPLQVKQSPAQGSQIDVFVSRTYRALTQLVH